MTDQPYPPHGAQLYTVDGRAVLRFERRYAHPPAKVWRAITEPAHLAEWFPAEMEMELRVGATIRFRFPESDGPAPGGTIRQVDPPHLFEFTWGGDVLRWELMPDGEGCLLRFTNTFDDRAGAGSFAAGWSGCLDALGSVLAGAQAPQPSSERFVELHEAYVAAFDLAAGEARETPGGWEVRFERQLMMAPVAAVWEALTGAQPLAAGEIPPLPATTGCVEAGAVTVAQAPAGDRQYLGGVATTGEPAALLEYEWLSGGATVGRVRWELYPGPGGARVVLAQSVPAALADQRATALACWHGNLELLVDQLRGRHRDRPSEPAEELRQRYAASVT